MCICPVGSEGLVYLGPLSLFAFIFFLFFFFFFFFLPLCCLSYEWRTLMKTSGLKLSIIRSLTLLTLYGCRFMYFSHLLQGDDG